MTRRQVRSLVRWEAVIIALLGAFLGIVIGVLFAAALVEALKDQGIDVFRAAPAQLVIIFVLAAIFGVLAAIWPARRASQARRPPGHLHRVAPFTVCALRHPRELTPKRGWWVRGRGPRRVSRS